MKTKLLSIFLFTAIFSFSQYTSIPDVNFEQALIDLGYDDVLDSQVLTSNINHITYLNVSAKNILDLKGIEGFLSLERLYCQSNFLTSLDLSENVNLVQLYCNWNQLTYLNIVNNHLLENLICQNNNLTTIDLSGNTELKIIHCMDNNIDSLDIGNNLNLITVDFVNNNIQSLDISNNINLEKIYGCLNQITSIDLTNNPNLIEISLCSNNLNEVNVNQNFNLKLLDLARNQISSINLLSNIALEKLALNENQLTSFDGSFLSNLFLLLINNNQLSSLNIKNGNNSNFSTFNAQNNPNLYCIQVDDAAWSEANWTNVDSWSTFSEDCQMSINEQDFSRFKIFPNPTKNTLNFSETLKEISIYDLSGKLIQKGNGIQINISNLSKGTYLLKGITNSGKTINQKFIKN